MQFIAFDLSLTCTGWARATIIDGEPDVEYGQLRVGGSGVDRLDRLERAVWELAESATVVGVEEYAFSRGDAHAHELGELGGAVRLRLHRRGRAWVALPIPTVKKFATGRGNAKKDDVFAAAIRRMDYEGSSKDETDALWGLALLCDHYGHPFVEVPQAHRESRARIAWPEMEASA